MATRIDDVVPNPARVALGCERHAGGNGSRGSPCRNSICLMARLGLENSRRHLNLRHACVFCTRVDRNLLLENNLYKFRQKRSP